MKLVLFFVDFIVRYLEDLIRGSPVIQVTLVDSKFQYLGDLFIPKLPQIPEVIVRGHKVFVRVDQSSQYKEHFAYFAPTRPLFL